MSFLQHQPDVPVTAQLKLSWTSTVHMHQCKNTADLCVIWFTCFFFEGTAVAVLPMSSIWDFGGNHSLIFFFLQHVWCDMPFFLI